jgi:hypothetical protein
MARWKGTTTQRGMGSGHQRLRQQRLAVYRPGDICTHGGEPMFYPPPVRVNGRLVSPFLDLPHTADRSGYLPGLSCAHHNRSEGVTRRNRMRGVASTWRTARRW